MRGPAAQRFNENARMYRNLNLTALTTNPTPTPPFPKISKDYQIQCLCGIPLSDAANYIAGLYLFIFSASFFFFYVRKHTIKLEY
jgi:hypothetical protein